jgi:hypothetical protein
MSMSTGEVVVKGNLGHYELKMPLYEMAHVPNAASTLFDHIHFSTGGQPARLVHQSCHEDMTQGTYFCSADYEFPAPVDRLGVECTFHRVTVPNHVHLLHAMKEGKSDQAIFDFSYTKGEIRFDPPTELETVITQTGAGAVRAAGGWVQLLFLAALVLAARSSGELMALAGMFLGGQTASAVVLPLTRWEPAPRFVEAAMALTIAYLAVEILALPTAGKRWLIAGVLGGFHGLYFALFLRSSEYHPGLVLAGAAVADVILITVLAWIFRRAGQWLPAVGLVRVSSSLLLCLGMFWFFLRLRG